MSHDENITRIRWEYIYMKTIIHCAVRSIIKIKIHSSCEIEDFVETHLCKLCVILRRSMSYTSVDVLHRFYVTIKSNSKNSRMRLSWQADFAWFYIWSPVEKSSTGWSWFGYTTTKLTELSVRRTHSPENQNRGYKNAIKKHMPMWCVMHWCVMYDARYNRGAPLFSGGC